MAILSKLKAIIDNGVDMSFDILELLERLFVVLKSVITLSTVDLKPNRLHLMCVNLLAAIHFFTEEGHHVVSFINLVALQQVF